MGARRSLAQSAGPAIDNHPMPPADARPATLSRTQRLIGRWWVRQSPARQDRFATLGPLVSVLLFLAAIISAFWYLRNEEIERETESVKRDTEIAQQQMRLRLVESQDLLLRLGRELASRELTPAEFGAQALAIGSERPEISQLLWIGRDRELRAGWAASPFHVEANPRGEAIDLALAGEGRDSEPARAFLAARSQRQPVYTGPFNDLTGAPVFQLHMPLARCTRCCAWRSRWR